MDKHFLVSCKFDPGTKGSGREKPLFETLGGLENGEGGESAELQDPTQLSRAEPLAEGRGQMGSLRGSQSPSLVCTQREVEGLRLALTDGIFIEEGA